MLPPDFPRGVTVYWAGRLFNTAETLFNRFCAEKLREWGYTVILPQEEARRFMISDGVYDLDALARDCCHQAVTALVGVFNLDGPDVDSGTAVEVGLKVRDIQLRGFGITLGVRTDFRAISEDGTTNVNAMFRLMDGIVQLPGCNDIETACKAIDREVRSRIAVPHLERHEQAEPQIVTIELSRRIPRPPCPFYGGHGTYITGGFSVSLSEGDSNCCALTRTNSPCAMEIDRGTEPSWQGCQIYNRPKNYEVLGPIFANGVAHVPELWTDRSDGKPCPTMPLTAWLQYVEDPATPRP